MKTAMISQPMSGKSKEDIRAARGRAIRILRDDGYDVIDTVFDMTSFEMIKNSALLCLGWALQAMSKADLVIFLNGWQDARGCRIEHRAAKEYGLDIRYEEQEDWNVD